MYRWQTLTLARAECLLFRGPAGYGTAVQLDVLDLAKNAVLHIGQRHFPEPDLADPPRAGADADGPAIDLLWRVEDREMVISIRRDRCSCYTRHAGDSTSPDHEPGDRNTIRELAHWLLFGTRPPKPGPAMTDSEFLAKLDAAERIAKAGAPPSAYQAESDHVRAEKAKLLRAR